MELDSYFKEVRRLAKICLEKQIAPQDMIEQEGFLSNSMRSLIDVRSKLIDDHEREMLTGYLIMEYFRALTDISERMAAFCLCFEVQHEMDYQQLKAQCEKYDSSQKVFENEPSLFEDIRKKAETGKQDYELVDMAALEPYDQHQQYKIGNGWGRSTRYLNPGIVYWSRSNFPSSPTYIRIDPHFYEASKPRSELIESTLVPANPSWMEDVGIQVGKKEFAAYKLEDVPASESIPKFWEYHALGIRRLEVHAKRNKEDYLSMMIEELPRPDEAGRMMIGRCVHLDTDSTIGTNFNEVSLLHLDLAINVYADNVRQERFGQTLQQGKVVDASFRTHLFRIENVPFACVFDYCRMFFRSQVLLTEWMQDLAIGGLQDHAS